MMTRKRMKAFLLLAVLLLSIAFAGCSNQLNTRKEKGIAKIDARLNELRTMKLEYSLSVIEYEAEKAKESIRTAEDGRTIQTITEDALNTINGLVLSESEMDMIKEVWYDHTFGGLEEYFPRDHFSDQKIMHYLGKIGGYYVAVVQGDTRMFADDRSKYYGSLEFLFEFLPEVVSLYKDGQYYSLCDEHFKPDISDHEVAFIHERFRALNAA